RAAVAGGRTKTYAAMPPATTARTASAMVAPMLSKFIREIAETLLSSQGRNRRSTWHAEPTWIRTAAIRAGSPESRGLSVGASRIGALRSCTSWFYPPGGDPSPCVGTAQGPCRRMGGTVPDSDCGSGQPLRHPADLGDQAAARRPPFH